MNINKLKDNLRNKIPLIGTWSHINSPQVVEIIGSSGVDFIIFDLEHGPYSISSLVNLFIAAENSGITPITRIPKAAPKKIYKKYIPGI